MSTEEYYTHISRLLKELYSQQSIHSLVYNNPWRPDVFMNELKDISLSSLKEQLGYASSSN